MRISQTLFSLGPFCLLLGLLGEREYEERAPGSFYIINHTYGMDASTRASPQHLLWGQHLLLGQHLMLLSGHAGNSVPRPCTQ